MSQAGIESVRGTSSDSAIGTLLQRKLIALDDHRLFTTTPVFLEYRAGRIQMRIDCRHGLDAPEASRWRAHLKVDALINVLPLLHARAGRAWCATPSRTLNHARSGGQPPGLIDLRRPQGLVAEPAKE